MNIRRLGNTYSVGACLRDDGTLAFDLFCEERRKLAFCNGCIYDRLKNFEVSVDKIYLRGVIIQGVYLALWKEVRV